MKKGRLSATSYAVIIVVVVAFLPLVSAFAAELIGDLAGCRVDEAGTHPCVVFGMDIGEMLGTMFLMGWLFLLTIPAGGFALLLILVVASLRGSR